MHCYTLLRLMAPTPSEPTGSAAVLAIDTLRTASAAMAFGLSALAICLATVAAACLSRRRHDRPDTAAPTAFVLVIACVAAVLTTVLDPLGRLSASWLPPAAGVLLVAAAATGWLAMALGRTARAVLLDGDAARLIGLPVRRTGLAAAAVALACAAAAGIVLAAGWPELPPSLLLGSALAGAGAGSSVFMVAAVILAAAAGSLAIGLIAAPAWILPCCVLLATLTAALVHRHA